MESPLLTTAPAPTSRSYEPSAQTIARFREKTNLNVCINNECRVGFQVANNTIPNQSTESDWLCAVRATLDDELPCSAL